MRMCSIASGSSGNCIYVGSDHTHLLVDTGISRKRIEERRAQLEEELKAAAMVEETRYQNTLEQLNRQVEAHREEWVSKLTAQCLKMEGCS